MTTTDTIAAPADAPSHLPAGWRWARLGDVVIRLRNGTTASQNTEGRGLPVTRIESISSGSIDPARVGWLDIALDKVGDHLLNVGVILFSHINSVERLGNCALYEGSPKTLVHGMNLIRIEPDPEAIDSTYLLNYLRSANARRYIQANARRAIGQASLNIKDISSIPIPLPPLAEQRRIAAILRERLAAVERARAAAEAQIDLLGRLVTAYLTESLAQDGTQQMSLSECLTEISKGVGPDWKKYRVVGATRAGLAPAKESVGKTPERYKLVAPGTLFYNPMRILLGSIAYIDDDEEPGITSPDYVVCRGVSGVLHPRWFYHWLRSPYGEDFIKSMTRGAVRERMLFRRLATAEIDIPPWEIQVAIANKLRAATTASVRITEQLAAINALPSALLRRAFRGEM